MNYSETYFELDSEEATHCDHCHLICCVYIKGNVEMVNTKDQSNVIVYCVWYVVCLTVDTKIKAHNALNAMFVKTVNTLVFVALTQHLIQSTMRCENYSTLYKVASCLCQEGRLFVETVDTSLIQYSKCSTQNRENAFMSTLSIQIQNGFKAKVHLIFKMFYSKQREKLEYVDTVEMFVLPIVHHQYRSVHATCTEIRSHPNSFHCICRHCRYRYNRITM